VQSDPELILEETVSIREALRRMVRYTSVATESLDRRMEDGTLDGCTEAEELREELDAYQMRHAR
jgi:hypothetical protein